jgi:hypothetical protein
MTNLDRRQKLLKNIDVAKRGLELGPLCWPLLTKDEAKIQYVDHVSTDELKKLYGKDEGVALDKIVDVDYPLNGRSLSESLDNKKVSYVIASHVIEHIPDVVRWLQDVASVLKVGGILTLAIPDKRYTFDIDRNVSKLSDVMGAYLEKHDKPSARTIFDYASNFRLNIDAKAIWWRGELYTGKKAPHRYSLPKTYEMCLDSLERNKYVDTHCTVFTPHSFFEILKGLIEFGLLDYKVAVFYDTAEGEYEFIVQLQKVKKSRKVQLASIPKVKAPPLYRELAKQVEQQKILLQERVILRNEIEQIRNSHSWKITKPLRRVTNFLRRFTSS